MGNQANAHSILQQTHRSLRALLGEIRHSRAESVKDEVLRIFDNGLERCKRIAQDGCGKEKPTEDPDYQTTPDYWRETTPDHGYDSTPYPWYDSTPDHGY